MMKNLTTKLVLALVVTAMLGIQDSRASQYEIGQFRIVADQTRAYDQQWQVAPGGSLQESQANQARIQQEAVGENLLNSPQMFQGLSSQEDLAFLSECESGATAGGGAYITKLYTFAKTVAGNAFSNEAVVEAESIYDFNQVMQIGFNAERGWQVAPGGSSTETAYNNIRNQVWPIALQDLQNYVNTQLPDFRQGEALLLNIVQQSNTPHSSGASQAFFTNAYPMIVASTVRLFQNILYNLSPDQLTAIQTEYAAKWQAAPGGSATESLDAQIRDAAKNRIAQLPPPPGPPIYVPPPPPPPVFNPPPPPPVFNPPPPPPPVFHPPPPVFPPPPPVHNPPPPVFPPPPPVHNPPPPGHGPGGPGHGPTCVIRSGANPQGQSIFNVFMQTGLIIANFPTSQQAADFATRDPRCR